MNLVKACKECLESLLKQYTSTYVPSPQWLTEVDSTNHKTTYLMPSVLTIRTFQNLRLLMNINAYTSIIYCRCKSACMSIHTHVSLHSITQISTNSLDFYSPLSFSFVLPSIFYQLL